MVQSADRRLVSEATLSNSGSVARSILNNIYAAKSHTHTSDQVTDFAEAARDVIAQMLANGTHTGITVTYDDANDRMSLTVTGVVATDPGTGSGGTGGSAPTEVAYDTDSAPYLLTSSGSVPSGAEIAYDTDGNPYLVTSSGSVPAGSEIAYDTDGNPYLV